VNRGYSKTLVAKRHAFLLQGVIILHENARLPIGLVFSYGVRPGDHGQPGPKRRLSGKCLASDAEVNKPSPPGCIHLIPTFSKLVYKSWCHGVANGSVSTDRRGG